MLRWDVSRLWLWIGGLTNGGSRCKTLLSHGLAMVRKNQAQRYSAPKKETLETYGWMLPYGPPFVIHPWALRRDTHGLCKCRCASLLLALTYICIEILYLFRNRRRSKNEIACRNIKPPAKKKHCFFGRSFGNVFEQTNQLSKFRWCSRSKCCNDFQTFSTWFERFWTLDA